MQPADCESCEPAATDVVSPAFSCFFNVDASEKSLIQSMQLQLLPLTTYKLQQNVKHNNCNFFFI